ncbi:DUF2339 domain-containing protein [Rhizobium sp. CFBP 8762]|uniref:DUF2339 domain-containing protein n=1 Tax=Rhizobium sp. CFBP 8762 TaxID=2775279 RepID=UPI0017802265|nr:DUF2339 domain-containing protein [Rhizobium sp. CFBP 8762]MBD8553103.1 DUF2339 domain-containing protein [Rhizobium sp. CFBP 8762]
MIEFIALVLACVALIQSRRLATDVKALQAELAKLKAGSGPLTLAEPDMSVSVPLAETSFDDTIAEPNPEPVVQEAALPPVKPAPKSTVGEGALGARWAVWVGGVALAFGGLFMVKYSIESGLLGPAVRLTLAAAFGLLLMLLGEIVRRRALPLLNTQLPQTRNALIPGVLTAAGTVSLFGAIYAAHGVYGFIGPTLAFLALALVALATVALSLLHGQALAGLGLVASMATPILVSSQAPAPWSLFGFLAVSWGATYAAARLRRWRVVPVLANIGVLLWSVAYLQTEEPFNVLPVAFLLLVVVAGVGFVWPAADAPVLVYEDGLESRSAIGRFRQRLRSGRHTSIYLTAALAVAAGALFMLDPYRLSQGHTIAAFVVVISALAALGSLHPRAIIPAIFAAFGAVVGLWNTQYLTMGTPIIVTAMVLSTVFFLCGAASLLVHRQRAAGSFTLWGLLMALVPAALLTISYGLAGNYSMEWRHAAFAALLAGAYIWVASRLAPTEERAVRKAQAFVILGAFLSLVIVIHTLTHDLTATMLTAALGFAFVLSTRFVRWPALPWMMVMAALVVLVRILWQPTVVVSANLGVTPVFNALLPGYGFPALLLVMSCYWLRHTADIRLRNALQALATLFVMLTIAILVRHGMNGGVLTSSIPSLGEQSLYTLITLGGSITLMSLNLKSASPVFRYGSLLAGVVSLLLVLSVHLVGLNPYRTGELLGRWPVVDLLLIGYLLPALAFAALVRLSQGRKAPAYVKALSASSVLLGFAWVTLSVRRFWQGTDIAYWKGFLSGETYTYSVVWLLLGVLSLVAGTRFNLRSLRVVSAVLVVVTVVKVFLVDMSNLEGFLRALSFIGLGGVLIGIGLFYQRVLTRNSTAIQDTGK